MENAERVAIVTNEELVQKIAIALNAEDYDTLADIQEGIGRELYYELRDKAVDVAFYMELDGKN